MPAWLLPAAMTGASLGGSILTNKAQEKAAEQAEAQRTANIGTIQEYGQRAAQALAPGYQAAQDIRQKALSQNLGLAGSTFRPMIEQLQAGDYMGQEAILAGLMGQRSAILGDPINYGALQARNVPVNYGALSGIMSPQGFEFSQVGQTMQAPEFMDTAFSAQQYLAANPDIAADYQANRAALIAGGDPQFRTPEGYAQWHYNNYGRAEGRPIRPTAQATTQDTMSTGAQDFSTTQVANIFRNMGGEP